MPLMLSFPGTEHRFCVRHLNNNFKSSGFRGLAYKHALWRAASCTTEGEWRMRMDELKSMNEEAWKWFSTKPPEQWSKAFFSEKAKCDMLLNNVCEAFNGNILEARDKAIITMLEWLREYLMKRLQKNRDRARSRWNGKLCPKIKRILEKQKDMNGDCVALKSSNRHYQISNYEGGQFAVDLQMHTCTCRAWQLTGIPCVHGMSALLNQREDPEMFVDAFYTVEAYHLAYAEAIKPISCKELWGESLYIPPLPLDFGNKKNRGRPSGNARRREPDEKENKGKKKTKGRMQKMKRQQQTVKCRNCGQPGHNSLTCKEPKMSNEQQDLSNANAQNSAGVDNPGQTAPISVPNPVDTGEGETANVEEGAQLKRKRPRGRPKKQKPQDLNNIDEPRMEPPKIADVDDEIEDIPTQQSAITVDIPYFATPQPLVYGPTMYQQLQLGLARVPRQPTPSGIQSWAPQQPRPTGVQIRAPPPFAMGQFCYRPPKLNQSKEGNKIVVDGEGRKFLDLSSQASSSK